MTYDKAPVKLDESSSYGLNWADLRVQWETFTGGQSRTTVSWASAGLQFRLLFEVKEDVDEFVLRGEQSGRVSLRMKSIDR